MKGQKLGELEKLRGRKRQNTLFEFGGHNESRTFVPIKVQLRFLIHFSMQLAYHNLTFSILLLSFGNQSCRQAIITKYQNRWQLHPPWNCCWMESTKLTSKPNSASERRESKSISVFGWSRNAKSMTWSSRRDDFWSSITLMVFRCSLPVKMSSWRGKIYKMMNQWALMCIDQTVEVAAHILDELSFRCSWWYIQTQHTSSWTRMAMQRLNLFQTVSKRSGVKIERLQFDW